MHELTQNTNTVEMVVQSLSLNYWPVIDHKREKTID